MTPGEHMNLVIQDYMKDPMAYPLDYAEIINQALPF